MDVHQGQCSLLRFDAAHSRGATEEVLVVRCPQSVTNECVSHTSAIPELLRVDAQHTVIFGVTQQLDFVHLVRVRRGRVRSSPVRHREVMMRTLPTTMLHLLNPFVPLFSRRLWPHVQVLLAGAILAPGKRTVSAALRVMGLGQTEQFQRYHRVLNRAVWSGREASHVLLGVLVRTLVPNGPLVIGVDETLERRWGKKISAKGIYRDPVRSTQERFVKSSGLRWVCLMLLVPVPWAGRVWALPFLSVLAPSERYAAQRGKRHKKITDSGHVRRSFW